MLDPTKPILTRPITRLLMSPMELHYVKHVYRYLREVLGCTVEEVENRHHHIIFPEGTVEEVYAGQSTQWTNKTRVRFPTGHILTKYVSTVLSNPTKATTMLAFPNEVLEPPKPPPQ